MAKQDLRRLRDEDPAMRHKNEMAKQALRPPCDADPAMSRDEEIGKVIKHRWSLEHKLACLSHCEP